jgi:signal transduction histidine kinase
VEARETGAGAEIEALRHEIDRLGASRRRLVLAADADRRAFERALHDGLQQQLVGLAANLELAARAVGSDPAAATPLLEEMRGDLREALAQTRALAHRIAPPLLEAGGLLVALRSAAESLDVPSRIDVAGGATLPPELASAVYSCFVEVLARAAAGATAEILVGEEEANLVFELSVDRVVDRDELRLDDRIEALGGELTVRSEPSGRTSWSGTLPLPR